ncbi:Spo0E like sporulation regulatory protein [Gracilibacillus ureilyticus]|uniref:Spo0E like sporulation regulatory protein n=1 Tax=Gracilibacillus ureilyticus TaxID=531814 RepID=A0A1H9TNA5_9BACI|nr:aspartyl-phosphate phosphatase Spo0E family protein [Gracilibacillus ureilyticus]SER98113.1 Spo0E like sporulation regulatory protein [Gracilibacillus ureilyticus]
MTRNTVELMSKIEKLRQEMADVALTKGITSKESLYISQELDRLLNDYEYRRKNTSAEQGELW